MGTRGMVLEDMGRRAAREYLENQTPLNDSISKFASAEGLNEESIKRVCETANVSVDGELFSNFQKAAMEGGSELFYPKFPLADAKVVVASVSGLPKMASAENRVWDDYDRAPMPEIRSSYDPLAEAALEKIASEETPVAARPMVALEKIDALRTEVIMRKSAMELKLENSADECYQQIKQQVLRGADIKELFQASLRGQKSDEKRRRVKDLFQLAARKLVDQGVKITADRGALKLAHPGIPLSERDKYITDLWELPEGAGQMLVRNGSYVNDEHPLFSSIDMLVRQYDEADRYDKALTVIDDKVKYVKEKVRGMTFGGA